jgi:DNA-binding Lrp family transcriptional regulator
MAHFPAMDAVDRKILALLQDDGRMTVTELAARLPLSVSRAQRRLRELESSGAIRGYRAEIDPASVGLGFRALVFVTMSREDRETVARFEQEVARIDEVTSARRLFGDPDFLLEVVTTDLDAYQRLYDERIAGLAGVGRLNSTLVMKTVVPARGLPV